MISEIKKYKISCDWCRKSIVSIHNSPPKSWKKVSVGPCGLTNYYRDDLYCPECYKKHLKANEKEKQ